MDQATDSAPAACSSSMAPNSLRAPLLGLDGIDNQANITWKGRDRRRQRHVKGAEPIAEGAEAGDNFVREGTISFLKLSGPSSLDVATAATNATPIEEEQREEETSLMYDRTPDAVARDPGRRRRALSDTSNLYENHGPGSTHPRHNFKSQEKEAVHTPLKSTPDFLKLREPTEGGGGAETWDAMVPQSETLSSIGPAWGHEGGSDASQSGERKGSEVVKGKSQGGPWLVPATDDMGQKGGEKEEEEEGGEEKEGEEEKMEEEGKQEGIEGEKVASPNTVEVTPSGELKEEEAGEGGMENGTGAGRDSAGEGVREVSFPSLTDRTDEAQERGSSRPCEGQREAASRQRPPLLATTAPHGTRRGRAPSPQGANYLRLDRIAQPPAAVDFISPAIRRRPGRRASGWLVPREEGGREGKREGGKEGGRKERKWLARPGENASEDRQQGWMEELWLTWGGEPAVVKEFIDSLWGTEPPPATWTRMSGAGPEGGREGGKEGGEIGEIASIEEEGEECRLGYRNDVDGREGFDGLEQQPPRLHHHHHHHHHHHQQEQQQQQHYQPQPQQQQQQPPQPSPQQRQPHILQPQQPEQEPQARRSRAGEEQVGKRRHHTEGRGQQALVHSPQPSARACRGQGVKGRELWREELPGFLSSQRVRSAVDAASASAPTSTAALAVANAAAAVACAALMAANAATAAANAAMDARWGKEAKGACTTGKEKSTVEEKERQRGREARRAQEETSRSSTSGSMEGSQETIKSVEQRGVDLTSLPSHAARPLPSFPPSPFQAHAAPRAEERENVEREGGVGEEEEEEEEEIEIPLSWSLASSTASFDMANDCMESSSTSSVSDISLRCAVGRGQFVGDEGGQSGVQEGVKDKVPSPWVGEPKGQGRNVQVDGLLERVGGVKSGFGCSENEVQGRGRGIEGLLQGPVTEERGKYGAETEEAVEGRQGGGSFMAQVDTTEWIL